MSAYDNIVSYLEALLGQISLANGYRTDAGTKVWKNLEYKTAPAGMPCSILYPGAVSDTLGGDPPPSQGEENHLLPISIEGFIHDSERGDQGEALRQDFLQALKTDCYFGGLTEGFHGDISSSSTIEDAGDEGLIGFVKVDATILYVTAYGGA